VWNLYGSLPLWPKKQKIDHAEPRLIFKPLFFFLLETVTKKNGKLVPKNNTKKKICLFSMSYDFCPQNFGSRLEQIFVLLCPSKIWITLQNLKGNLFLS